MRFLFAILLLTFTGLASSQEKLSPISASVSGGAVDISLTPIVTTKTVEIPAESTLKIQAGRIYVLTWPTPQKPNWDWREGKSLITFADALVYERLKLKPTQRQFIIVMRPGKAEAVVTISIRGKDESGEDDEIHKYSLTIEASEEGKPVPDDTKPTPPAPPNSPLQQAWAKDKTAGKSRLDVVKFYSDLYKSIPSNQFDSVASGKELDSLMASAVTKGKEKLSLVFGEEECANIRKYVKAEVAAIIGIDPAAMINADAKRQVISSLRRIGAELEQLR